jgi:hypothetical protein
MVHRAKRLIAAAAAGAVLITSSVPALADGRDRDRDRDGIGAGEIIAGALIIGGIAALVSSGGDDDYRPRRYDDRRRYDHDRRYGARDAVERCVRAAEREAYRTGFRRADVSDIRDVRASRDGYRVKGRIAVDTGYRDGRYGRGWNNDYRGYRDNMSGWDSGKFTCRIERGRVVNMDYDNIRGLR